MEDVSLTALNATLGKSVLWGCQLAPCHLSAWPVGSKWQEDKSKKGPG
jgi:hypothetical protein